MTDTERKATSAMAGAKLAGGEHEDDVRGCLIAYLMARGWLPEPAKRRAREVVSREVVEGTTLIRERRVLRDAEIPVPRRPLCDVVCASCPFRPDRGGPKLQISDRDMVAFRTQARFGEFYCHMTVLEDPRTKKDASGDALPGVVQPHFKVCRGAWEYKLAEMRAGR